MCEQISGLSKWLSAYMVFPKPGGPVMTIVLVDRMSVVMFGMLKSVCVFVHRFWKCLPKVLTIA